MTNQPGWAPAACTLPTAERPIRAAEFDALFATSLRSLARLHATRLRMTLAGAGIRAVVEDLTAREAACCSFFTFTVCDVGSSIQLDISVPSAYSGVLDGLERQAAAAAGSAG